MANFMYFAALSDSTRKVIFDRLRDGPSDVTSLARDLPVSRPAVSQHLKVLKAAGLVADHPQGARRIYRVDWTGLNTMRAYLDSFWAAEIQRQLEDRRHS